MSYLPRPPRRVAALLLVAATGTLVLMTAAWRGHRDAPPAPAASCATPEFRQFDFFAGDWDTYDIDNPAKVVARNRVTIVLDGCALREVYEEPKGLAGESLSLYDPVHRRWHQSWVTNRGSLLLLNGGLEGGRMVLTGPDQTSDGRASLLRGIWWKEGADVREKAERSLDGGKTWTPAFDIVFRPHRESP